MCRRDRDYKTSIRNSQENHIGITVAESHQTHHDDTEMKCSWDCKCDDCITHMNALENHSCQHTPEQTQNKTHRDRISASEHHILNDENESPPRKKHKSTYKKVRGKNEVACNRRR